jgi:hypothetical protein
MVLAPEARIHSARLEAVGGGKRGARVTGGADDGDAAADGVEGDRGGLAAEVERQHVHRTVHAVVDGGVERRQDVRVEALAAVHGREAHAVAPPRARAGRRAVAEPEHRRAGHRRAHRRGQRVHAVPVRVAGALRRRVPRAPGRRVALLPFLVK